MAFDKCNNATGGTQAIEGLRIPSTDFGLLSGGVSILRPFWFAIKHNGPMLVAIVVLRVI
jgi:hypothetical protein